MSARDAGFLYLERSHTQLHIGCVAILEGALRREDLIARIEERLPRLRRYGQRAMHVPLSLGHPSWEDDPDFRVEHHVARWGLPAPGGESELREAVARLFAVPLDRERPLWEMHLLEGLADGRTALFQKVHHCMIDGMAGAQLLETLLDGEPRPAPRAALSVRHELELPDARQRFARALGEELATRARGAVSAWRAVTRPRAASDAMARLRNAAFSALQLATSELVTLPWNAPLGPRRAVAFTKLPLRGVRSIRAQHGGSVNDVVLATLAGGLKRWLEAGGRDTRGLELRALVPVSLRSPDEAAQLGNRISAMLVPLAVDPAGEVPRLAATRAATERLKTGGAWTGIDALLERVQRGAALREHHLGGHERRGVQAVHRDLLRVESLGERHAVGDLREFALAVGLDAAVAALDHHVVEVDRHLAQRRDQHDPGRRAEAIEQQLGEQVAGEVVDLEAQLVAVLGFGPLAPLGHPRANARVVDEDVHFACLCGEPAHVVERAEVGLQRPHPRELARDRRELGGIAPVEQELRALGVQPGGERAPESVGRAGDEDHALGERPHDLRH
jgi:WS/DGAT/MGAT family acyltransferase